MVVQKSFQNTAEKEGEMPPTESSGGVPGWLPAAAFAGASSIVLLYMRRFRPIPDVSAKCLHTVRLNELCFSLLRTETLSVFVQALTSAEPLGRRLADPFPMRVARGCAIYSSVAMTRLVCWSLNLKVEVRERARGEL